MTPSAIEEYLLVVARQLRHLPAASRSAELAELRAHLLALAADYQAQGMDADAAAAHAVAQFGPPKPLGSGLRRAWYASIGYGRALIHYAGVYVASLLLIFAFLSATMDKPTDFAHTLPAQIAWAVLLPLPALIFQVLYQRRRVRR